MTTTPVYPHIVSYNHGPTDLQSASATKTPDFIFPSTDNVESPIAIWECPEPFATCRCIKTWLLEQHQEPDYRAPGILRMDHLELEKIDRRKHGWVIVAPEAAELDARAWLSPDQGQEQAHPKVSILALFVRGDERVRWFYTLRPISPLLSQFDAHHLSHAKTVLEPGVRSKTRPGPKVTKHARLTTFLRETFSRAIKMPDSPCWTAAQGISDFCPSILDPATASGRLWEDSWLHWNTPKPEEFLSPAEKAGAALEPSDDRYLLHLPPAERVLASLARLRCAEYLFVKRNFFRAFYRELYRSGKAVGVATATATPPDTVAVGPPDTAPTATAENPVPLPPRAATASPAPGPSSRNETPFPTRAAAAAEGTSSAPPPLHETTTPTPAGPSQPPPDGATPAPARTPHGGGGGSGGAGHDRAKRNRVRSERAHQLWLEQAYGFRTTPARTLVVGWRILGFLDEGRYARWIREGWGGDVDEDGEGLA